MRVGVKDINWVQATDTHSDVYDVYAKCVFCYF